MIENTQWALAFKRSAPSMFDAAMRYILAPDFTVVIIRTDELNADENVYALLVNIGGEDIDFWLEAFISRQEAINRCDEMGWKHVIRC